MKVFSAFHNLRPFACADYIVPLQTGVKPNTVRLSAVGDNSGDNIAAKNLYYRELTGLYWIWKNVDAEVVGFCHYRRFFSPLMTPLNKPIIQVSKEEAQKILLADSAGTILQGDLAFADAIVAMRYVFNVSLEQQFFHHHGTEFWNLSLESLQNVYPEEGNAARTYFRQTNSFYGYNMVITKKQTLDTYCDWMFPVLEDVEKNLRRQGEGKFPQLFGHMGERLFCWWLYSRGVPVVERPVIFCPES
jgi:Domain of unknown function (DUF4422)